MTVTPKEVQKMLSFFIIMYMCMRVTSLFPSVPLFYSFFNLFTEEDVGTPNKRNDEQTMYVCVCVCAYVRMSVTYRHSMYACSAY